MAYFGHWRRGLFDHWRRGSFSGEFRALSLGMRLKWTRLSSKRCQVRSEIVQDMGNECSERRTQVALLRFPYCTKYNYVIDETCRDPWPSVSSQRSRRIVEIVCCLFF